MVAARFKSPLLLWTCTAVLAFNGAAWAGPAQVLLDKYQSLASPLQHNPFQRPLTLASVETPHRVSGDIYAVADHPFKTLRAGLSNPQQWCEVISLHSNTKYCRATVTPSGSKLIVRIGTKTPEELSRASRLEFDYSASGEGPDYMTVLLVANSGPMGTSDYRIALEAVALPGNKSFLHLSYSYTVSVVGQLAMQTYLATSGSGKVGFTVVGHGPNGELQFVGGIRGVVERNTMRYYLAIDSVLQSMTAPSAARFERRLQIWFAAAERYPLQLHDVEWIDYLSMKRAEREREQALD